MSKLRGSFCPEVYAPDRMIGRPAGFAEFLDGSGGKTIVALVVEGEALRNLAVFEVVEYVRVAQGFDFEGENVVFGLGVAFEHEFAFERVFACGQGRECSFKGDLFVLLCGEGYILFCSERAW